MAGKIRSNTERHPALPNPDPHTGFNPDTRGAITTVPLE